MSAEINAEYIALIKSCGYRVFAPVGDTASYVYYTDGRRIGYAQWSGLVNSVSTVHIPNKQTGTGFRVAEEITPETLAEGFALAPHWAYGRDVATVKKFKDWAAFAKAYWQPLIEK